MKISGVVVLYNPDSGVLQNIKSYIDQIEYLFVVDNSEKVNDLLVAELKKINKIEYKNNFRNLGVATALNIGALKSINKGFDFILTMDQDSFAHPDMIRIMLNNMQEIKNPGIISPHHKNIHYKQYTPASEIEEPDVVITSGNLLNLNAFQDIGGFDENLFIDYVDIDICFRLKLKGYKIYKVNSAILNHNEGNLKTIKILNKTFRPYNHDPLRWYYKIRNYNYIKDKYYKFFPSFFKEEKKRIKNDFLKIILFEEEKIKKMKYAFKGYSDYKNNRLGKFNERG